MKLIPITADSTKLEKIKNSEFLLTLCSSVISLYPEDGAIYPWMGYLAEEHNRLVGSCAFKTPPVSGQVEIAYFTFPECERNGVGKRMAQRLVDVAFKHGVVRVVAQTLPTRSASTSILESISFKYAYDVIHPEDGRVWEWHLNK